MDIVFDKYNSVPFTTYFNKMRGSVITIDSPKRILKIYDETGKYLKKVHFASTIHHDIDKLELLSETVENERKVYYVYENGAYGHDWLWYYDTVSLENLL